ncbi:ABC transporter substrate-binding protein [Thalassomonas haliotis]|nr:ABC transporter substrate-binding protein [Thalassomonas haliotis]
MMKSKLSRSFSQMKQFNLLGLLLLLLSGCYGEDKGSLSANSVIYCAEGSPESFNPQTVTSGTTIDAISYQLYDRLISFQTKDNEIGPSLAKSWHVTRDGKMITFYLRKDVSFHQTDYFTPTRSLNADDVLFSFNRLLDPGHNFHFVSGGKYPFFQSVGFSSLVDDIEKINDYTVRFKLSRADSSFLANLATDFAVILSAEYAGQLAAEDNHQKIDLLPVGTGPYKFKEYRVGSLIRYYRHENYWRDQVAIEQLVYDITPSKTGRLTKLLANECDVIAYPVAHEKITEHANLTLEAVTSFNVSYLGFNTQKPPFDNKLVRQAIAYAINKQAIIDAIYFGHAEVAKSLLPASSWAHDRSIAGHGFSISKAKALLAQAGYPDGLTMDIWALPVQRAYNPNALTTAKLIQADLQQIGVTVNIVSNYEWSTFSRLLARGEHQAVLLGWSADHPDPDNFFTPILSCASMNTGNNRAFWCDPTFDNFLYQSLQTTNTRERKKHYAQALRILSEEVPLLPIAHSRRYQARHKNVQGELLHPFGGIDFSGVSKN